MQWTWKSAGIKQGILMGLAFCLYTTLMWLTKLDSTHLHIGQYLDMAIVLLPVFMILWAIRQALQTGEMKWWERIVIALIVGLVSFVIYDPYLYVYHHYINPEWFEYVLTLKELELQAANSDPVTIAGTLRDMRESQVAQAGLFRPSALIPSVIIIPSVIALLSLLLIKRKK